LRRVAEQLRASLVQHSTRFYTRYPPQSENYPYYEAYVLLLWSGKGEAFKTGFGPADEARVPSLAHLFDEDSFQAWLRRKQAAALLHFAAKLGFRRFPLGGAPMITHLADGSVRDFLEIMGDIYDAIFKRDGKADDGVAAHDRFAITHSRINWRDQANGIYSASTSFLSGISNRSELDSSMVTRFIDGLGIYTAFLQSNPHDPSVLGRAERGIFMVRFAHRHQTPNDTVTQARENLVWNVIRQAELAGYIRTTEVRFGTSALKQLVDQDVRIVSFRLHHRFAPHFRFSYRGAYESVALAVEDLAVLLDRVNQIDSKSWAQRMANRPSSTDDWDQLQFTLAVVSQDD
jgi:hypothetical protein